MGINIFNKKYFYIKNILYFINKIEEISLIIIRINIPLFTPTFAEICLPDG